MSRRQGHFQGRSPKERAPRTVLHSPPAPPAAIDPAWQRWVGENLLLGADRATVIARLVERGCPVPLAAAEVARAIDNPYFQAASILRQRLAKRDWQLACQAKLEAMQPSAELLPRRHLLGAADFARDHYFTNRPVVLTGLIDTWAARHRWSFDYLAQLPGETIVEVQTDRDRDPSYEISSDKHRAKMPLSELLPLLRHDQPTNDFYVTANNGGHNRAALAPLWNDIGPLPGYLIEQTDQDGFLWIGPRGTLTPWHHDLTNNLLVQMVGRKKITLVSPSQTPAMRNFRHCFSSFATDAAFAELPETERPQVLSCILHPGEILFIPLGWWHHVQGLDATIGLSFTNFVWDNDFSSFSTCYDQV
jgi:hypothetical protein